MTELHRHIAENEAYYARIESTHAMRPAKRGLAVAYEDLGSPAEHARLLAVLGVIGRSVPWWRGASSRIRPTSAGWSRISTRYLLNSRAPRSSRS